MMPGHHLRPSSEEEGRINEMRHTLRQGQGSEMGSGPSAHHQPHDMMVDPHQYPDMNVIFRGIPKMMQVADDMHRMTNYIMDLRNMTIGLMFISAVGVIGFLILRFCQGRSGKRRRRSYLRHAEEGYGGSMPRYYYQSQYAPEPWERPKSTFSHQSQMDPEKKPLESRNSPETKPNGNLPYKSPLDDNFSPELIKKASTQSSSAVDSSSRLPHKRSLEPIKLLVEDLPYADT